MAAESYQQSSATVQLEAGKNFIHTDVLPKPEDTILDLGCGTGELSAYLAELVGPREGNSNQFEGMGSEKFDIIFSNFVLHWIPEKSEAFRNMLNSLKPGGKVAIQYVDALPPLLVSSLEILNPETHEQLKNKLHLVKRDDVDLICTTAGFTVVRSYYARKTVNVYPSVESLLQWLVSTSQGVFDLQLVTQERIKLLLQKFGNPPFDFTANAFDCKLVAVKPKSSQTL
ncbi:Trans-aconitate 2-methyltransferase [Stylophora pistillata]|uniref:Trans-aconitate 2-methyltransferase n=1 Tax=Stylophora pistillata TaxID=50429 RepID=A0A2B4RG76_STYPI|nr:Trans-aconitate 2-methyltransferase [Stylophora pistillata]